MDDNLLERSIESLLTTNALHLLHWIKKWARFEHYNLERWVIHLLELSIRHNRLVHGHIWKLWVILCLHGWKNMWRVLITLLLLDMYSIMKGLQIARHRAITHQIARFSILVSSWILYPHLMHDLIIENHKTTQYIHTYTRFFTLIDFMIHHFL